jgi:hypothetical protein
MVENTAQEDTFNWWPLVYAAVGTSVGFLPFPSLDVGAIFYLFVAVSIVSIALLLFARRDHTAYQPCRF